MKDFYIQNFKGMIYDKNKLIIASRKRLKSEIYID